MTDHSNGIGPARDELVAALQWQIDVGADEAIGDLQNAARSRSNVFEELMRTVKSNSLGQITSALYEVGGEYRRNM